MLDPVSAVGLASGIVQLVHFTKRLLSDSRELYNSADGALVKYLELEDVSQRLESLLSGLHLDRDDVAREGLDNDKNAKSQAKQAVDHQLEDIAKSTEVIIRELLDALTHLKIDPDASRWASTQAAFTAVWKRKKLRNLDEKIDTYRKQLDTALLVSIRQWMREHDSGISCLRRVIDEFTQTSEDKDQLLREINQHLRPQTDAPIARVQEVPIAFPSKILAMFEKDSQNEVLQYCSHKVVQSLHFPDLPLRQAAISEAHEDTFKWIWTSPTEDNTPASPLWYDFHQWLRSDSKMYWVTGKPGSGKSTLLKYLLKHRNFLMGAEEWAERDETGGCNLASSNEQPSVFVAAFFFWCAGTKMQQSMLACLRSLLHSLIQGREHLIRELLPERWQRQNLLGSDSMPFLESELMSAVILLLSRPKTHTVLLIDGLDEFEGKSLDIADFVLQLAAIPNVKVCTASRPWTVFEDRFSSEPSLRVENLTEPDILHYVRENLGKVNRFRAMQTTLPERAERLVNDIVSRASGVFLWVFIVVGSLVKGLIDGNSMLDLEGVLESLPTELEDLFDHILNDLEPQYAREASEIFQFHKAFPRESTISAVAWIHTKLEDARGIPDHPWNQADTDWARETMRRRLYSRCKCLLEVDTDGDETSLVRYLHRTARDYLEQPHIWHSILKKSPDYDLHMAAAISSLLQAKTSVISRAQASQPFSTSHRQSFKKTLAMVENLLKALSHAQYIAIASAESRVPLVDAIQEGAQSLCGKDWLRRTGALGFSSTVFQQELQTFNRLGMSYLIQFAMVAKWDWYILDKYHSDPNFLAQQFDAEDNLFGFAIKNCLWHSQALLLQNGASPAFRCVVYSAWELIIQQVTLTPEVIDHYSIEEALEVLSLYIDRGANLAAKCPSTGVDAAQVLQIYTTRADVSFYEKSHLLLAKIEEARRKPKWWKQKFRRSVRKA